MAAAMDEKFIRRDSNCIRLVFFLLGIFLAASIGLAIALGVLEAGNDDNKADAVGQNGWPYTTTTPPVTPADIRTLCTSSSCVFRAGELLAAMDRSVDPCQDFYQYSCGNWMRTHSIPESESSYSRFGELRDSVRLELKGLLEDPYNSSKESMSIKKIKSFYQSCADEEKLTKLGTEPLKQLVEQLGPWPLTGNFSINSLDLESRVVKLGYLLLSPLMDIGVYKDNQNSSTYITWIDQLVPGINRDYFLRGRNSSAVVAYEELLQQLAIRVLDVPSSSTLEADIAAVVDFELQLANVSASLTDRRNAEKYYKKVNVSELQTRIPKFSWLPFLRDYFKGINLTITNSTLVALFAEDYLNSMLDHYEATDKRVVANYLLMRLVSKYSSYLNKEIRDLNAPLRKVLYGVTAARARWKTCVDDLAENHMAAAAGQLYVKTYFTSTAKQKAAEMISFIRGSIEQMIRDVSWMDQSTKDKALEKADAMIEKIGYPDNQFNETALEEIYMDVDPKSEVFFQNVLSSAHSRVEENSRRLLKVPTRKDWSIAASTVNAFYSPSDNSITFPAGILQPPFYAEDFPVSMKFGGIGMVIGHEMTHGFDDQGRKYNKEGNNVPWWPASVIEQFQKRAMCFSEQYSQYMVAGSHVNGNLTLGENIADNGGIKAAFKAFEQWQASNALEGMLPGLNLSHPQLFFVSFAQGWCDLITDEGARDRLLTDPHSPAKVRVLAPISNSPDFARAYGCQAGSPMNPSKKCELW